MAVLRTMCRSTTRTAAAWAATAGRTRSAWARAGLLEAAFAPRAGQVLLADVSPAEPSCSHTNGPTQLGERM